MATNILGLADYIQGQYKDGLAQGRQSKLAQLAGQAYGAPADQRRGLVQQAIGVDPEAGFALGGALQGDQEARMRRVGQMAGMLLTAPPEARAGLYAQQIVPELNQLGMGGGLPSEWTDDLLPSAQGLYQQWGGGGGASASMQEFNSLTSGLSPEQRQDAVLIKLGLKPRAVTGAMRFDTFTDANGNPRPQRNNPTTGDVEIYVDEQGRWIPLGSNPAPQVPTVNGQPIPEEDMPAFLAAVGAASRGEAASFPVGGTQSGGTGLGVGRSKEAEAAAVEAAKRRVELATLPAELGMRTEAAISQSRGQARATADVNRQEEQRQRDTTFHQFETAMAALESGLAGTNTNPVTGNLPAVTPNQQIAEGAVAAIAPILKQLFRAAGEGVFTDKDQELLMAMVPTREDFPAARKAKMDNIRAIVAAKLGQTQGEQAAPQAGGVLRWNPETGDFE